MAKEKDLRPESVGPRAAKRYESQAAEYLADEERTDTLLDRAKSKSSRTGLFASIRDDFLLLVRMIRAYVHGNYRRVPWKAVLAATAAVVYFVTPFDFVPDFIAGLGLVDDAAVMTWTLGAIHSSLNDFRAWERTEGPQA